jgi:hypothetical protein
MHNALLTIAMRKALGFQAFVAGDKAGVADPKRIAAALSKALCCLCAE